MANTLTNILPKILARALMTLREQVTAVRVVNRDYGTEAARKGTTIDVPIPVAKSTSAVTPSNTPPAPANASPDLVQIPLDQWEHVDFHLTDKEMVEIDRNEHFIPMEMGESIRALANSMNAHVLSQYKRIYGYVGVAGTTPFGSDASELIDARKVLNQQLSPRDNRSFLMDYDAEAQALALAAFADAEKTGENGVKIEGEVGRKYGFLNLTDDQIPTHTAGSLTGTIVTTGANAAGVKIINLTTDAAEAVNLLEGDIVTFAGDTQTYVVTADATIGASTTGNVNIEPGLKVAQSGGEQISVKASHVVNLAIHRDAFAFANRPLQQSTSESSLGSEIAAMTDPKTGISLRLEVSRQFKQVVWDLDALWGSQLVRRELAVRVAG